MKPRLGLALSLALLLPLFGCTAFPVIEGGVCGNAVIDESKEDCDTFAEKGLSCRPPGSAGECHYDCRPNADDGRAPCPSRRGCYAVGIGRRTAGNFETSDPFDPMMNPLESMYCVPPTCALTRVSPESLTQKAR